MTVEKTLPLFEPEHEHILIFHPKEALELNACSICGASNVGLYHYECTCDIEGWAVICWNCYMNGSTPLEKYETAEKAVRAWNGNSTANSIHSARS